MRPLPHALRPLLAAAVLVSALACKRSTSPTPASAEVHDEAADRPTQEPGFVRELRKIDVSFGDGATASLDAMVTRPADGAPAPLVVLNHGSPRDPAERAAMAPTNLSGVAMAFARRGYAVVAVMRRGFGTTGGGFAEAPGRCDDRVYLRASKSAARDVLGAVDALSKETWVDPSRVVLVGHSAGGMAVLAAAAMGSAHASPRIVAVISFAGGRGSDAPDHVCQPERLVESLRVFGRDAKAPSLWVYAENDHFFSPAFARSMFDGYRSSGAPAELAMVPPFGAEGHAFFTAAPVDRWWPVVEPFLAGQHLPTAVTHPRAPVTLAPPEVLTPAGRDAWAAYLASESVEKAFATGGARWGWSAGRRTQKDAIERAVSNCEKHGQGEPCKVVAIGDAYAP